MLTSLLLAAASELKTHNRVDSAEAHIVKILFFCRDTPPPSEDRFFTHIRVLHKSLMEEALRLQAVLPIPQPG